MSEGGAFGLSNPSRSRTRPQVSGMNYVHDCSSHCTRLPGTVGSPHGHLYLAHDARISSEGASDRGQGVSIW